MVLFVDEYYEEFNASISGVKFVLCSLKHDDPFSWKKTVSSDYGKYDSLHCSQEGGKWLLLRATLNRSALNTFFLLAAS